MPAFARTPTRSRGSPRNQRLTWLALFFAFVVYSYALAQPPSLDAPQTEPTARTPLESMLAPVVEAGDPALELFFEAQGSATLDQGSEIRPSVLRAPDTANVQLPSVAAPIDLNHHCLVTESDAPQGFTGPSGILPSEVQTSSHFVPVDDRWRVGFPDWDRYGKGHPPQDDYPGIKGAWWDPYNQNVLKGDYPVVGQHTFMKLTARIFSLHEGRQVPTPTTPFEATRAPGQGEFFGDPDSYTFFQNNSLAVELFHGNAAFKPADWRIKLDLIYNMNLLVADELAIVSPDVRAGTGRFRQELALEEWFLEAKLADTSPYYDFTSIRVGSQPFVSDFRGFIFVDINRGVRLFGTRLSNRDQFNIVWFDQTEKDTK